MPLLWSLFWWGQLTGPVWSAKPLTGLVDAVPELLGTNIYQVIILHGAFLDVTGVTLNPLQLHGPWSLIGWDFIWCGLSSLLVVSFWLWAAHWVDVGAHPGLPTRRQFVKMLVAVLIWTSPMLICLVLNVLDAQPF